MLALTEAPLPVSTERPTEPPLALAKTVGANDAEPPDVVPPPVGGAGPGAAGWGTAGSGAPGWGTAGPGAAGPGWVGGAGSRLLGGVGPAGGAVCPLALTFGLAPFPAAVPTFVATWASRPA
jgi:hypothetical protein